MIDSDYNPTNNADESEDCDVESIHDNTIGSTDSTITDYSTFPETSSVVISTHPSSSLSTIQQCSKIGIEDLV